LATSAPACTGDRAAFDALVAKVSASLKASDVPGAAMAIVCGGQVLYTTGIGQSARTGGHPVDAHTRYQLASTTKTLTALLALRLVDAGKLSLSDFVAKYVPTVNTQKPYARAFTVAELLSHSSGFAAYLMNSSLDLEPSLAEMPNAPLWSPPGEVWNYSNTGFALAGLMLERASGEKYAALLPREIFQQAGMADARLGAQPLLTEGNYAIGDSHGMTLGPDDPYVASTYYAPMGGVWASAEDMAHLAQTLLKGPGLLSAASYGEWQKARVHTDDLAQSYGLGLFIEDRAGTLLLQHGGDIQGFHSSLALVPSRGFALAMLFGSDTYVEDVLDEAVKTFTGRPLPAPPDGQFRDSDVADHVGTYDSVALGTLTVARAGGQVTMTIGGQAMTLKPAWRDAYNFTYAPWQVELTLNFVRKNGFVTYLVTRAGVGTKR
jgi:CubicO group peptidase (beta-lactamase class C family)